MILWRGSYQGRLPRINERYGTRSIAGKARAYVTPEYRTSVEAMALSFAGAAAPITEPVNVCLRVSLWSRIDTDAPIKGILDALEKAGVLDNDKQVQDFAVRRDYHKRDEPDTVEVMIVESWDEVSTFPDTEAGADE